VARVNQDLQRFPGADETSKFSDSEVLNLLEWSLPAKWCCKFDYDGYIPSEHDKARLLKECEAIEQNQQQDPKKDKISNNQNKKDRNGRPVHETSKAEHRKGAGKTRPERFCDECGKNYTHNTAQCWKLKKKNGNSTETAKRTFSNKGVRKEINLLAKAHGGSKKKVLELYSNLISREQAKIVKRESSVGKTTPHHSGSEDEMSVNATEVSKPAPKKKRMVTFNFSEDKTQN
jgi:hypothetical protein